MGALDEFNRLFENSQKGFANNYERRITPARPGMTADQLQSIADKLREVEEMVTEEEKPKDISIQLYYIIGLIEGHAENLKPKQPVMREPQVKQPQGTEFID